MKVRTPIDVYRCLILGLSVEEMENILKEVRRHIEQRASCQVIIQRNFNVHARRGSSPKTSPRRGTIVQ